jgi:excisionase family DNA binding protein
MSKTPEPSSSALAPPDLQWLREFLGRLSLVNDQRLTVQEVAHLLRISVRSVWRWVRQGRLPAPVRFTRACVRWPVGELLRSLDNCNR